MSLLSAIKQWATKEKLKAADLNTEFQNIYSHMTPDYIEDASANETEMLATRDPYPGDMLSKPMNIRHELQCLRYMIQQITGKESWPMDPSRTLETIISLDLDQTFLGNNTHSGKNIFPTENEFTASQHLDGAALLWRFRDTTAGGKEWGIRSKSGNLEICENTGTEEIPVWTARLKVLSGDESSAGQIAFFARSAAPAGWLKANGAAVSRTTYADLFAAIDTGFGNGDGSTTFNLPDLRGEFLRALDDGRGVDIGRLLGSAQADEFKSHTHDLPRDLSGNDDMMSLAYTDCSDEGISSLSKTGSTGGTETRPRNIALLACIRYRR